MFDLLEKGMREPDENDWMLAYSLEGHPELHLSHHYFRGLSEEQAQHIVGKLKEHFANKPLQAKPIQLNQVENFGPEQDIRVLVNDKLAPHLDPEIKQQMEALHPSRFPTYRPHVTTQQHENINSKISGYYFQRGNGQTYFSTSPSISESRHNMSDSTNAPLKKAVGMPKVNAKVEGIEVKRPMTGVAGQKTSVSSPAMPPPPKVGVPPKLGAQSGKMNNMPTPQGATLHKTENTSKPILLQKIRAKYKQVQDNKTKVQNSERRWKEQQSSEFRVEDKDLTKTDSASWLAAQQKNKPAAATPKEAPALDYSVFNRPTYSKTGVNQPIHNPIQHSQGALTGMHKTQNDCNTPEYIVKSDCMPLERLAKLRKCMALKKANASGENAMPVFMRE